MDNRKDYHKTYYQKKREDPEWIEEQKIVCQKYKQANKKNVVREHPLIKRLIRVKKHTKNQNGS